MQVSELHARLQGFRIPTQLGRYALSQALPTSRSLGSRNGGVPRVGVIASGDASRPSFIAFQHALAELGYVEGRGVEIEPRFCGGQLDRLPGLAAELGALRVDVIAAIGAVQFRAAQLAAPGIPSVFAVVVDPVAVGLVADLERPGASVTGVTNFDPGQARSQIKLLKETIPNLTRLAIVSDAGVPDALPNVNKVAAEAEGLSPQVLLLRGPQDFDAAFSAMSSAGVDALLALGVPIVGTHGAKIAELATRARLPTMFARDEARFGPMLAYGTSLAAAARRMAKMVVRILEGENAGDLPVERVTRHELIVNLPVARAVGISVPPQVIARADQVID